MKMIKFKPHLLKSMVKGKGEMLGKEALDYCYLMLTVTLCNLFISGGMSEEQMDSFVDYVSSFSLPTLQLLARLLRGLGACYKPALEVYQVVDRYTLNSARYLLLALGGLLLYLIAWVSWKIGVALFTAVYSLYVQVTRSGAGAVPAAASVSSALSAAASTSSAATIAATGAAQALKQSDTEAGLGPGLANVGQKPAAGAGATVTARSPLKSADSVEEEFEF